MVNGVTLAYLQVSGVFLFFTLYRSRLEAEAASVTQELGT